MYYFRLKNWGRAIDDFFFPLAIRLSSEGPLHEMWYFQPFHFTWDKRIMIAVIKYLKMYGRGVIFGLYDFRWGEIGFSGWKWQDRFQLNIRKKWSWTELSKREENSSRDGEFLESCVLLVGPFLETLQSQVGGFLKKQTKKSSEVLFLPTQRPMKSEH